MILLPLLAGLGLFAIDVRAATYTYPAKSINLSSALSPTLYAGFNPEDQGYPNLIDPHAVHGVETADGSFVYCGKAVKSESSATASAFAVKISSSGSLLWAFSASTSGGSACNAVVELPATSEVALVGWRTVSGVGKRSVTVLNSVDGSEKYTHDNFGDSSGRHGAFEMGSLSTDGSYIFLSGLKNKADLSEMSFKSYGNIPDGTAVVQKLSLANLKNIGSVEWSKEFATYMTSKAVRPMINGNVLVQLYGEESNLHATVALLKGANGEITWLRDWGSDHGEGTDIQVSTDEASVFIIGQGNPDTGGISGRLTKVSTDTGTKVWTKTYSVGGNPNLIFNECWGGVTLSDGSGLVVSCGAGIEGDQCDNVSGQDKTDCLNGDGDKRAGAYRRGRNNWQSFTYKVDNDGELLWQRVDSFKCEDCPDMAASEFDSMSTTSSAGEWVFERKTGGVVIVTDESFGFGALVLSGGGGGDNGGGDNGGGDNGGGDNGDGGNEIFDDDSNDLWSPSGPLPIVLGVVGIIALGAGCYAVMKNKVHKKGTKLHGVPKRAPGNLMV